MRQQLALANVKPRLRMTSLYYLANRYNGLVVGTGNKTELAIGYFTKYGDGGVDVLPQAILTRPRCVVWPACSGSRNRSLTRRRRPVSGKARPTRRRLASRTTSLTVSWPTFAGEEHGQAIDPTTRDRVSALVAASEHKRRPIPMFRRDAVDAIASSDSRR